MPTDYELSSTEAAEFLGVHYDTLIRWTDAGKVACWTTPGGRRRYRTVDLEALLPPVADAGAAPAEATR